MLIVEDEPSIREIMQEILTEAGYQVTVAASGREALAAAAHEKPGLVLVDLLLVDMRGDDLMRTLREMDHFSSVPMVVMTGAPRFAPPGERMLQKPFNIDALLATVADTYRCQCAVG